ncbi:MAG: hypothetical protein HY909_27435 [Deltaproteobacteria bacterium]|nr:hypothetical protein [Deltaproteobacteria bacterium]
MGLGVAYRDTGVASSQQVFIGYAGYAVQAEWSQAWVSRLYHDALRAYGVRHVYAVQGPADAGYSAREIGNSRLIAHLLPRLGDGARVLVAAHSSGSFVAHELLGQLFVRGLDPGRRTAGRVVYYDLDGGGSGLDDAIVGQLRRGYFVWSQDGPSGTRSQNAAGMIALGARWPRAGGAVRVDASGSGCRVGAGWCMHMTVIVDRPHNPADASVRLDYTGFDDTHRVVTAYLTSTGFGGP